MPRINSILSFAQSGQIGAETDINIVGSDGFFQYNAERDDWQISDSIKPIGTSEDINLGSSANIFDNIHGVSGHFNIIVVNGSGVPVQVLGISGIVINNDGLGNLTVSQNAPVDARQVRDHINPDTNNAYDLGVLDLFLNPTLAYRTLVVTSGFINSISGVTFFNTQEATINGINHSTLPPIIAAIQGSGGPVDQRLVQGHINPDANGAYDIGLAGVGRYRRINANSGLYDTVVTQTLHAADDTAIFQIDSTGTDVGGGGGPLILGTDFVGSIRAISDSTYDIGHPTRRWREIYGTSGIFDTVATDNIDGKGETGVSINDHLMPGAATTYDIGSIITPFRYISGFSGVYGVLQAIITMTTPSITVSTAIVDSGSLTVGTTSDLQGVTTTRGVKPNADNTSDIGAGCGLRYRTVFMNSGIFTAVSGCSPIHILSDTAIIFDANNAANQMMMKDSGFSPVTNNGADLGSSSLKFNNTWTTTAEVGTLQNNGSSVSIGDSLIPDADSTHNLGEDGSSFNQIWGFEKFFVMPHPLTSGAFIKYTTIEGPESAAYVRGSGQLSNGTAQVQFGGAFKHVQDIPWTTIYLTPMDDCNGLMYDPNSITPNGFTVKELLRGTSNARFSWYAVSRRWDTESRPVVEADARHLWSEQQAALKYINYKEWLRRIGKRPRYVIPLPVLQRIFPSGIPQPTLSPRIKPLRRK